MNESNSRQCKPCEGGVEALGHDQITAELRHLPGWQLESDEKTIMREFKFSNFTHTMAFINAMAQLAEQQGHHPDFCAGYNYCKVRYTTHAIDGLSINDVICAALVNKLQEL